MTPNQRLPHHSGRESLADSFGQFFEPVLAQSDEQQRRAFKVRCDVYCHEFHYEREEDCDCGLEMDEYDQDAVHGLVVHRPSGQVAGCVRVVPRGSEAPPGELPLERHCGHTLKHATLRPSLIPNAGICEISRLAVHGSFRRRSGERVSPIGDVSVPDISTTERRSFPLVSVALFLVATNVVKLTGKPHVFAMMEPRLARLLKRSGLVFSPVGAITDFHGRRAAHYIHVDNAIAGLNTDLTELYGFIADSLRGAMPPRPS